MRTRSPRSRCAHGTKVMSNVWMHNGFLQVEGRKMSKSEGNFYTITELLHEEKFGGRMAGRGAAPRHADDALPRADRLFPAQGLEEAERLSARLPDGDPAEGRWIRRC